MVYSVCRHIFVQYCKYCKGHLGLRLGFSIKVRIRVKLSLGVRLGI